MPRIEIGGTSLEYAECGHGDPVVLVHGSASDHRTWQSQLGEFGKRFHVITYSRRYHWPNERISASADYSMAEHVDDLHGLMRSLNVAPAHLVGSSYGAFLCLLLAVREPAVVRTLVLAEAPVLSLFVSTPPTPAEMLKLLVSRPSTALPIMKFGATGIVPATKAIKRGEPERAIRLFGTAVLGRDTYRRLSPARMEQVRANFINAEILGSGFAALSPADVRRVQVPTLLLTGERSRVMFRRLTDRLAELLPGAERCAIPEASHIMHEDNAPAYNAAVMGFLKRHSRQDVR